MNSIRQTARTVAACNVCKRRKEKCNGLWPCARCVKRKVEWQCHFSQRHPDTRSTTLRSETQISEHTIIANEDIVLDDDGGVMANEGADQLAPVQRLSRLVRHPSQRLIFLGDHANSSFLHSVRKVIRKMVWHCALVNDPSRNRLVDVMDSGTGDWLKTSGTSLEPKPEHKEGRQFLESFLRATDGVLEVLSKEEVEVQFAKWLQEVPNEDDPASAKYYLILALGAQSDMNASMRAAETYFKTGRYLSMIHFMDKPSLAGVQCFVLITMFLVTVSRRNAAVMNLGIAVQAAHAIGLHQGEASKLFTSGESKTREGTWKSIRCLDVLLSGSLGRPLATAETRPVLDASTSAMVHVCWITETIIKKVYVPKIVPTTVVEDIIKLYREWTGLLSKRSQPRSVCSESSDSAESLDIGTLHLETGYHTSIMLLMRPFLLQMAGGDADRYQMEAVVRIEPQNISSEKAFGIACVDSAARIVDFARKLQHSNRTPRHLPFVVNAVFLAGICLGLGFFANLHEHFALDECLEDSLNILKLFTNHDIVAQRCLCLLNDFKTACRTYVAGRDFEKHQSRKRLVADLLGNRRPSDLGNSESLFSQDGNKRQRISSPASQHSHGVIRETMTGMTPLAQNITPQSSTGSHSQAEPTPNLEGPFMEKPDHIAQQILLKNVTDDDNVYIQQSSHWFDLIDGDTLSFNGDFWNGNHVFSLD